MNNKGFTLIELITTIGLLSIIAIISFVSINKVIDESKKQNCKTLINNIKTAAKEYASDHRYDTAFINQVKSTKVYNTTADYLINENYLSSPIVNPYTNEEIDNPSCLSVTVYLNDDYTTRNIYVYDTCDILDVYCGDSPPAG